MPLPATAVVMSPWVDLACIGIYPEASRAAAETGARQFRPVRGLYPAHSD
jgi:hypothetical protein